MSVVRDERAVYFPKYLHLGGDEAHSDVLAGNKDDFLLKIL